MADDSVIMDRSAGQRIANGGNDEGSEFSAYLENLDNQDMDSLTQNMTKTSLMSLDDSKHIAISRRMMISPSQISGMGDITENMTKMSLDATTNGVDVTKTMLQDPILLSNVNLKDLETITALSHPSNVNFEDLDTKPAANVGSTCGDMELESMEGTKKICPSGAVQRIMNPGASKECADNEVLEEIIEFCKALDERFHDGPEWEEWISQTRSQWENRKENGNQFLAKLGWAAFRMKIDCLVEELESMNAMRATKGFTCFVLVSKENETWEVHAPTGFIDRPTRSKCFPSNAIKMMVDFIGHAIENGVASSIRLTRQLEERSTPSTPRGLPCHFPSFMQSLATHLLEEEEDHMLFLLAAHRMGIRSAFDFTTLVDYMGVKIEEDVGDAPLLSVVMCRDGEKVPVTKCLVQVSKYVRDVIATGQQEVRLDIDSRVLLKVTNFCSLYVRNPMVSLPGCTMYLHFCERVRRSPDATYDSDDDSGDSRFRQKMLARYDRLQPEYHDFIQGFGGDLKCLLQAETAATLLKIRPLGDLMLFTILEKMKDKTYKEIHNFRENNNKEETSEVPRHETQEAKDPCEPLLPVSKQQKRRCVYDPYCTQTIDVCGGSLRGRCKNVNEGLVTIPAEWENATTEEFKKLRKDFINKRNAEARSRKRKEEKEKQSSSPVGMASRRKAQSRPPAAVRLRSQQPSPAPAPVAFVPQQQHMYYSRPAAARSAPAPTSGQFHQPYPQPHYQPMPTHQYQAHSHQPHPLTHQCPYPQSPYPVAHQWMYPPHRPHYSTHHRMPYPIPPPSQLPQPPH